MDAGNLLFKHIPPSAPAAAENRGAEALLAGYRNMGYDAVAVGPHDLAAGLDFLTDPGRADFPWVSANLYGADNRLLFPPFLSKSIGGVTLAFVGITGAKPFNDADFSVTDGSAELERLLPKLSADHDLIVILASTPYRRGTEIARLLDTPGIVITSDRRKQNMPPVVTGNALITQTTSQGKYLGELDITWNNSGWGENAEERVENFDKRLEAVNWKLQRLDTVAEKTSPAAATRRKQLEEERDRLERERNELTLEMEPNVVSEAPSYFHSAFIPLNASIPPDPAVEAIVSAAQAEVAKRSRADNSMGPEKK